MNPIWSKRNHLFLSKKYGHLLFNGNTGSFFKLDASLADSINQYKTGKFDALDQDVIDLFIKTGVLLCEDDTTLLNILRMKSIKWRTQLDSMELTLAPTLDCNFRCTYCYEKSVTCDKYITTEIIDKLVEYLTNTGIKKLSLMWYGGEPLLAIDKIRYFNEKIALTNIKLTTSIVTNGYLLTLPIIEYLDTQNLKQIQITLDGEEKCHNSRRPHVTENDSYQKIMENIDILFNYYKDKEKPINVAIRVNVDQKNINEYLGIRNFFESKYGDFFYVYSAFVENCGKCHSTGDVTLSYLQRKKFLVDNYKDFSIIENGLIPTEQPGCSFCQAQSLNNYVIDPEGNFFKCWEDVGKEDQAIGSLLTNKTNETVESEYIIKTDPLYNDKCMGCILLFLCKGGCPKRRLEMNAISQEPECSYLKTNLNEFLEYYYEIKNIQQIKKKNIEVSI